MTRSRSSSMPNGTQLAQAQPVGRQRAGLVGAQHIDTAERLDSVGLLDQRAEADQANGTQGVGDGNRHEQAVGNEAGQHRRLADGVGGRDDPHDRGHEEQQLHVGDDQQGQADDRVHVTLERRQDPAEGLGALRDLVRQAGAADVLDDVAALAGDAEAAREDLVAGLLEIRSDSPVSCDSSACSRPVANWPSSTIWSPETDLDQVADDQRLRRNDCDLVVAHDIRHRPRQQADPVERPLGADLLQDADDTLVMTTPTESNASSGRPTSTRPTAART